MPIRPPSTHRRSSFDSDESETGSGGGGGRNSSAFINLEDGLTFGSMDEANRQQRILQELAGDLSDEEDGDGPEFPTTILVTGFDNEFFEDEPMKQKFEILFRKFGSDATFYYFRSFKRVRVSYVSAGSAVEARLKMHLCIFEDYLLKCYFGQVLKKRNDKNDGFLHPPTPDKQFLISPPASPPVDWEPCPESHPILDYDLIAALAKLGPGDTHELHKPESESHPSIVVQIADDVDENSDNKLRIGGGIGVGGGGTGGGKIVQTKRPDLPS